MTTTQVTAQSAPRDTEGLSKLGRFNLRILAQEIGMFDSEANKGAFMSLNSEGQVKAVQAKLAELDGATASTPARTPSNKGAKGGAKAAANGAAAATPAASQAAPAAGAAPAGAASAQLLAKLDAMASAVEGLREEVSNLAGQLAQTQSMTAANNRFVTVAIGLSLKLAEQVLEAGAEQVLGAVIDDMPMVEQALSSLPGAEEGDEDQGNG